MTLFTAAADVCFSRYEGVIELIHSEAESRSWSKQVLSCFIKISM